MKNIFAKLTVGAVIVSAALVSGVALAQDTTAAAIGQDEARTIAQSGTCAAVGMVKADEGYNQNSQTWWFTLNATKTGCAPACVVNAMTKAAEVNWRCTGALPALKNKKQIDLPCAATAVAKRETGIASAFTAKTAAVNAAFTKRASDLGVAWTKTVVKERNAAVAAAWKTFNAAARAARKAYQTANLAAWKTFRTEMKACNASTTAEPSGSAIDAAL